MIDPSQGGDINIHGKLRDGITSNGVLPGRIISFDNTPEIIDIAPTETLTDGIFETKGTASPEDGLPGTIGVKFNGDEYYSASTTVYDGYTVQYSPGGIGADVAVIADIADLITYDNSLADTDKDGIPDSWETGGIPYSCATGTCSLTLPDSPVVGTGDVYVEIDGFANHVDSAAIANVDTQFSKTHVNQIRPLNLHYTLSDTSITEPGSPNPYVINLWRDTDTNRANDYDSLKADYFGAAADRVTFTGTPTNSGSGSSVTFNGATLLLTSPGNAAYDANNKVFGNVYLKMKVNLSATPTGTLTQTSASCTGVGSGLTITNAAITSTFSNGASGSQKIITTKIPFQTTGQITSIALGSCTVNLSIPGGATVSSVASENVSPVIFTEKQLAKLKVYRYFFLGHSIGGPSGRAEIWGNDAIIALGAYTQVNGHGVGTTEEQAGTFMHELGHTLNLDHGGARWLQPTDVVNPQVLGQSSINCKPNYISIMGYHRQLPGSYLNQAAVGGAGGWNLNYSNGQIGDLDEYNLKEVNGLVSGASAGSAIPRLVWGTPGV
ncbi:MAG: hypothetical protein ACRD32_05365, partial [Nitrososphaerales archaeon]